MNERTIDPQKRKEVQKVTTVFVMAMTVVILGYVGYALVSKNLNMLVFEILLGSFVVIYTLLNDVAEPYRLGIFQDMTFGQRNGLIKILVMDVVGIGALLYWISGMHLERGNDMLFPVIIYVLSVQMKRRFRPEFEGTEEEEEEAPETPEVIDQEAIEGEVQESDEER